MTAVATDFSQFAALRQGAARNDPATLRAVAGQFEALFIETMLKGMREASLDSSLFDSGLESGDRREMYLGMLDRQLSLEMAGGRGIGLGDMLVRQLGGDAAPAPSTPGGFSLPASRPAGGISREPPWSSPADFARDVWPHVRSVAGKLNVAPEAVLAQAALESGWGAHVMRRDDGGSSLNLFGVKAGSGWRGGSVVRPTVEFEDGAVRHTLARFRAYPDIAATFEDYASLVGEHPRYRAALNHGEDAVGFARALQEAGYATDPAYAAKIERVLGSDTMRRALSALKYDGTLPINILRD